MQIVEIEHKTGLDRSTIRFYEKEGLVVPKREENGYRVYSESDLRLLLKIKLLRQLGVSLFNIKILQQGSGDFYEILDDQIKALEGRILLDRQAKYVCQQMRQDHAQYATLDSVHYLQMLQTPILTGRERFQEPVRKESHPWRRYFARMMDYALLTALMEFLLIVVFRIRPFKDALDVLIGIVAYFVAIPVFAAMLHFWGTTPGKWVMGIRIEDINGGKLSYYDAFMRECDILWPGLGFFIPILSHWRMYESYREDSEGEENYWNHTSEIIYVDWNTVKKACLVGLNCIILLVSVISSLDTYMPSYIGNRLTLKRFAKCHYAFENQFDTRTELVLGQDGKWIEHIEPYVIYMTLDTLGETERPDFQFNLENGFVRGVRFTNSWESQVIFSAIPEYCMAAMYTLVGSRPGSTYFDILHMERTLSSMFTEQLATAVTEGSCAGSFTVNDVEISWIVQIEGCDWTYEGQLFAEDEKTIWYSLDLNMEIIG